MRHIVLAFGVCGLLLVGMMNAAGGQPSGKDNLVLRRLPIKLVGKDGPVAARVSVFGGDGKSYAPAGAAIRKTKPGQAPSTWSCRRAARGLTSAAVSR